MIEPSKIKRFEQNPTLHDARLNVALRLKDIQILKSQGFERVSDLVSLSKEEMKTSLSKMQDLSFDLKEFKLKIRDLKEIFPMAELDSNRESEGKGTPR